MVPITRVVVLHSPDKGQLNNNVCLLKWFLYFIRPNLIYFSYILIFGKKDGKKWLTYFANTIYEQAEQTMYTNSTCLMIYM